jgi:hypothetical protein
MTQANAAPDTPIPHPYTNMQVSTKCRGRAIKAPPVTGASYLRQPKETY